MSGATDVELKEVLETILREVDAEQVYLFGSEARGDAKPGSDIDVLIVENDSDKAGEDQLHRIGRLYRALAARNIGRPFDILLYTSDEFNRWRGSLNHIIGKCSREGRLLYARH